MPRGIPSKGYRMTKSRLAQVTRQMHSMPYVVAPPKESEASAIARIARRFLVVRDLLRGITEGRKTTMFISGPPGIGKTHTVKEILEKWDDLGDNYEIVSGTAKATGVYAALYRNREKGRVVVFDDCDSIFKDVVALNVLKAACGGNKPTHISWKSQRPLKDEDTYESLESSFTFRGSVVFLTNIDFDRVIARENDLSVHLQALQSRSLYVSLDFKDHRDILIWIKHLVLKGKMLQRECELTDEQSQEVLEWFVAHQSTVREFSLRQVVQIGELRSFRPNDWKTYAQVTCCK